MPEGVFLPSGSGKDKKGQYMENKIFHYRLRLNEKKGTGDYYGNT